MVHGIRLMVASAVLAALAVPAMAEDWSGAYVGGQFGYGRDTISAAGPDIKADTFLVGVHAGYAHDFGTLVLGGEVAHHYAEGLDVESHNSLSQAGVKLGYDRGVNMPYLTGGIAKNREGVDARFVGVGLETMMSETTSMGVEVVHYDTDTGVPGADSTSNMLSLRSSYRF